MHVHADQFSWQIAYDKQFLVEIPTGNDEGFSRWIKFSFSFRQRSNAKLSRFKESCSRSWMFPMAQGRNRLQKGHISMCGSDVKLSFLNRCWKSRGRTQEKTRYRFNLKNSFTLMTLAIASLLKCKTSSVNLTVPYPNFFFFCPQEQPRIFWHSKATDPRFCSRLNYKSLRLTLVNGAGCNLLTYQALNSHTE